jgi:hypothetical protein
MPLTVVSAKSTSSPVGHALSGKVDANEQNGDTTYDGGEDLADDLVREERNEDGDHAAEGWVVGGNGGLR